MNLVKVSSKKEIKNFLHLPVELYKNDKYWIQPLDKDIEEVFDPKKNKCFRGGDCERWVLYNNDQQCVGRIAAFINKKTINTKSSDGTKFKVGGIGFFECIEDPHVAFKLFDTAKKWLEERDVDAIDGPINFGERDKWWGLLVDGFEMEPNYNTPYTKFYYQQFFENYGFQEYFKQYTYGRPTLEKLGTEYAAKAERIARDVKYSFTTVDMKNLDKYAEDFRIIYNSAWANHSGVATMSSAQSKAIFYKLKPLIDPKVVYFGYYDKVPISFFISIPELNQIFKHAKGKFNLWTKLIFVKYKLLKLNKKLLGIVFGVVPEQQGKGVEGAMVMYARNIIQDEMRGRYTWFEMNWIGDFNPKMMKVASRIGKIVKTHATYRYMINKDLKFERCPIIE